MLTRYYFVVLNVYNVQCQDLEFHLVLRIMPFEFYPVWILWTRILRISLSPWNSGILSALTLTYFSSLSISLWTISLCFLMRASSPFCRMSPFLRIPFSSQSVCVEASSALLLRQRISRMPPSSILCHVVSDQSAVHFVKSLLFYRHHPYFVVFCKASLKQPIFLFPAILLRLLWHQNVIVITSSLYYPIRFTLACDVRVVPFRLHNAHLQMVFFANFLRYIKTNYHSSPLQVKA